MKAIEKKNILEGFTTALPILRASLGISQAEVAEKIGISRQTYCALEQKKCDISWNTFLSLFLFFYVNDASRKIMLSRKELIYEVKDILNCATSSELNIEQNRLMRG